MTQYDLDCSLDSQFCPPLRRISLDSAYAHYQSRTHDIVCQS